MRGRREPPQFRQVTVAEVEFRTPRLMRVTLTGPELEGFELDEPAASVRLLLPPAGERELVMPTWNGNEFLLADGSRPIIRTLTPRRFDPEQLALDVEIVLHAGGAAAGWAAQTSPEDVAAISGPGRGYEFDPAAIRFLLAGDETAIPAMSQLLEALPPAAAVEAHIEVATLDARVDMPHHPNAVVEWHELSATATVGDAMAAAVRQTEVDADTHVWVAGEAAAVQRIRRFLFEDRGLSRRQAVVRGYWKHGRAG